MLPRATALDDRPLGAVRRAAHRFAAWWRVRALGGFVVAHCAIAGALQLGALIVDLSGNGRQIPGPTRLAWAWLGLALIASIPALVTTLLALASARRTLGARIAGAAALGVAFYLLPVLALAGTLRPVVAFVPVAALWHATLAFAPLPPAMRRDTF
jgi:hypothetical protein